MVSQHEVPRMEESEIRDYLTTAFDGVVVQVAADGDGSPEMAWGDSFFFYDPDGPTESARRFPFATIVTKDYGDFDKASKLDRPGVYRLNISLGRESFASLFPDPTGHDCAALDRLIPHPVYAAQHWVSILNPAAETFETVKPVLAEAHALAVARYRSPQPDFGWG